jgi:hypothetical protein
MLKEDTRKQATIYINTQSPTIKDNVNHNRRKQNFKSYDVMQYIKRMEVHIQV